MIADDEVFPKEDSYFGHFHGIRLDNMINTMHDDEQIIIKIIYFWRVKITGDTVFNSKVMNMKFLL